MTEPLRFDLPWTAPPWRTVRADTWRTVRADTWRELQRRGTIVLDPASQGEAYLAPLRVLGGTPPYAFEVVDGYLPQGLDLDAEHGTIAGTPALGDVSAQFAVTVADAGETDYRAIVMRDEPVGFWRFTDAPGATVAADEVGSYPVAFVGHQTPNLLANPSFEVNTAGWVTAGAGTTAARVSGDSPSAGLSAVNTQWAGAWCLEVDPPGTVINEGCAANSLLGTVFRAGRTYTFSVYVRGTVAGQALNLTSWDSASGRNTTVGIDPTTTWARYSVTWTPAVDESSTYIYVRTRTTPQTAPFRVDAAQVTESPAAVAYSDTQPIALGQPGKQGAAVRLDGQGGYAQITPFRAALATQIFTFSGWVRINRWPTGTETPAIIQNLVSINQGYRLHVQGTGATARLYLGFGTTGSASNALYSANGSLQLGVWHHVAVVYDGTTMRLYLDGTQRASLVTPYSPNVGTAHYFGYGFAGGGVQYLAADLDEFALYDRALDADAIAAHAAGNLRQSDTARFTLAVRPAQPLGPPAVAPPAPPIPPILRLALDGGPELVLTDANGGPGSELIHITEVDYGYPDVREVSDPRPQADGTVDRTRFFGARAVQLTGKIAIDWDARGRRQAAKDALAPFLQPDARPWLYSRFDDGRVRRIQLRADQFSAPQIANVQDLSMSFKSATGVLEDETEVVLRLVPEVQVQGRVYPLVFDRVYPPGSGTTWIANNRGNQPADWTAQIFGPCSGPALVNVTTGEEISLAGLTLTADQFVEVSSRDHTVLADGLAENSRWHTVDYVATTWWQLPVGTSAIRFRCAWWETPAVTWFRWRHSSLL